MAGTQSSGRPGGNPQLSDPDFQEQHGFKKRYDYSQPLTVPFQLKITKSMAEMLSKTDNRAEFARQAILTALEAAGIEPIL